MNDALDRLGPRARRRMTPRVGVVRAGAGLGGDRLVTDDGDVQRLPGLVIALVVLIAGYLTLVRVRTGALASAGATAATLGVPLALFFLTFDEGEDLPFSVDAVLLVSALAWGALYVAGPGRGRLVFAAAALVGLWLFALNLVEPIEELSPFAAIELGFDEREQPDFTDAGVLSLLIGVVYVGASFALSRRGYDGTGTAFVAAGIAALVVAVQLLVPDLEESTGYLAVALGLGLAVVGAAGNRRATAWIGAAGVGIGTVVLVQDAVSGQSATGQSLVFLVVGLVVVVAGHLAGLGLGEPAEEDERRSFRASPDAPRAGDDPGPPADDSLWAPPTSS